MPIISMIGLLLLHPKSAVKPEDFCLYVLCMMFAFSLSRGRRVYNYINLEQSGHELLMK